MTNGNHANVLAAPRNCEGARSWLNATEAMALAGCCRRTLGDWMTRGYFKWSRPVKAGSGRVRIDRTSFECFLAGETQGVA